MKILDKNKFKREAFTLVEVCVALFICVLFGAAAFATNSRLVLSLKNQKESTAATTALQERMESLRGTAFPLPNPSPSSTPAPTSIANANYIQANIFTNPTQSEGPLGSLSETVTVDAYPTPTGSPTVLLRNSQYPSCQIVSNNTTLSNQNLLRVDVVFTWTSANGRSRTRQFSEIFGHVDTGQ
jgi:type II secretory pathway pseudopilin PulG